MREKPPERSSGWLHTDSVHDLEAALLVEAIRQRYGYDFRNYELTSLRHRLLLFIRAENIPSLSILQDRILRDPNWMQLLFRSIAICVTSMFRNPSFFLAFRREVIPLLRTFPFVRIWHAGCATGEEVYSMAIVLAEEGLLERCRLFATDVNTAPLDIARRGVYPARAMDKFSESYIAAGGTGKLANYYTLRAGEMVMTSSLREAIVFAQHNLATDASFNQFHVVLCRNVLIYFNEDLRNAVHRLLYDSLVYYGILGLGEDEHVKFTPFGRFYEDLAPGESLFKKIK